MTELASKCVFPFEPVPAAVAVDAAAIAYTTPTEFQESLEDLARLSYVKGRVRYRVTLDAASVAGAATLRLTDGTTTLYSVLLDLTAGTLFKGASDVDVSAVNGASSLRWELEVTTAADAGRKAVVCGHLLVTTPLVIGTC
ncbi:MAG TPA: hypothetical protein VFL97_05175 [Nitrococcus sp.]|nr:hypothetical protein [Nitrococcus sp.]